jgi:hypothetical protein
MQAAPTIRSRPMLRSTTIGEVVAWSVAAVLLGAAGIHFAMMGEHAGVSWTHGTFFAVVAWVQIVLAIGIVWSRSTRWMAAGVIVVNLAILGVWVLTRTVGIAIGGDGTPEAWGRTDILCAVLEGLAIAGAGALLVPRLARRPLSAGVGFGGVAFVGVVVAAIVTLIFSPAGANGGDGVAADGHDHGGSIAVSADGHDHGVTGAASLASAATLGHTHTHGPTTLNGQAVKGVKAQDIAAESQPDQPLDAATRATLRAQLLQARDVALRYPTVADATAAGYHVAGAFAPGSGAHYIGGPLTMPGPFHADQPQTLIYAGTSPTSEITGLMYYGMGETAPEGFAGPNDHWHRHSNVCIKGGGGGIDVPFPADAEVTLAQCTGAGGTLMKITGWMVHAWVVPTWESPLGVFSHDNPNVRCADGTYKTDARGFCAGT